MEENDGFIFVLKTDSICLAKVLTYLKDEDY